jgi:hypothetical protein
MGAVSTCGRAGTSTGAKATVIGEPSTPVLTLTASLATLSISAEAKFCTIRVNGEPETAEDILTASVATASNSGVASLTALIVTPISPTLLTKTESHFKQARYAY